MTDPRITQAVSRMAAVLVHAAGGEIRVPLSLIDAARTIHLHQRDDPRTGEVIYSTRGFSRVAPDAGALIEGEAKRVEPGQPYRDAVKRLAASAPDQGETD